MMVSMGTTRRRSPGFLLAASNPFLLVLMIISIFVCPDLASATRWQDVCTLGDTYIERSFGFATPTSPYYCDYCISWCMTQCSSFGTSRVKNPCSYTAPANPIDCQCCCSKRPSTSPQLPPNPPSVGQFTGGDITNICTFAPGLTYLPINHAQGTDCVLTPQCENKCQETGLISAGSQCVGAAILGDPYTWIEQCCCRTPPSPPPSPPPPSPPPPSPSPPPPPSPPSPTPPPSPPTPSPPSPPPSPCPSPPSPGTCCGCCSSNINIQISVKSGGNVKLSTPSSLSAAHASI